MYAHSAPPGINFRNYSLQNGLNAIFKIRFLDKHFIRRHKIHFININYVHFHINYALKVELTSIQYPHIFHKMYIRVTTTAVYFLQLV